MPKLRLDFWNKDFYKHTALGRTISGRNKTGQVVGVVKDTALSAVPFIGKPLSEATGRITDALEAKEIGKEVQQLNLTSKTILVIRGLAVAVLGYLVVTQVIGIGEAKDLLALLKQAGLGG